MFKKPSQGNSKCINPTPNIHPFASTSNKENVTLPSEPISSTIRSKIIKNKVKYFLKLAAEVI